MNKIKILLIVVFAVFSFACTKESHEVRVVNNFEDALTVKIGEVDFGRVQPGETTSYRPVPKGSHEMNGDVKGTIALNDKGVNKWTVEILENKKFAPLKKD
jgi:hypothetical protein